MKTASAAPAGTPGAAGAASRAPSERVLLLVDDDTLILRSLESLFGRSYRVVCAESGDRALELLRQGLRPQVIVSDHRMPGLSGPDFLEQSIAYVPEAVRVIMTGQPDIKDILAGVSRGSCYLYLLKPWQVVEVIQAVRLCFQYHDLLRDEKRLGVEVQEQNALLRRFENDLAEANRGYVSLNRRLRSQMAGIAGAFGEILDGWEEAFHESHRGFTARLCGAVARRVGFPDAEIPDIEMAASLRDIGKIGLSPALLAADPATLVGAERALYESHVDRSVGILSEVVRFEKVREIVSQHHERPDGGGFPRHLRGRDLGRETQIVFLAGLYHDIAFRLTEAEERRQQAGEIVPSGGPEREARQRAASEGFLKVAAQHDPWVVQGFRAVSAAGEVGGFRLFGG